MGILKSCKEWQRIGNVNQLPLPLIPCNLLCRKEDSNLHALAGTRT